MRRSPAVLLLLALLFAAAFGSSRAAIEGWNRVTHFSPVHFRAPRPTTGPPPLAERLVIILIDGLRTDDAARLPSLDWLTRQGSRFGMTSMEPPYQGPMLATILTGTHADVHGELLPPLKATGADTLPLAATRAGISSGAVGNSLLARLISRTVQAWYSADPKAPLHEEALPLLGPMGPALVILQTDQLHGGSHTFQTADKDSSEYIDLLARLDTDLVQVLQQIDLSRTAVMVAGITPTTADGGHTPAAPLPLILAGAGVRAGGTGPAFVTDIAPTAAALLGLPVPLQNTGTPLWPALIAEGPAADTVASRWLESRRLFTAAQLEAYQAETTLPDAPVRLNEAETYLAGLDTSVSEARFAFWKRSLVEYGPYFGGGAFLLLLLLLLIYRRPGGGSLLMGTLVYTSTFHSLFFLSGGRYSALMAGFEWMNTSLLLSYSLQAIIAMGLAAAVTGALLGRRGVSKGSFLTVVILQMALATVAVLALPVMIGLGFVLWQFPVALVSPGLLVWFFLTALQIVVIGGLSPLWALTAILSNRLARRIWSQPEGPSPDHGGPNRKLVPIGRARRAPRHR